MKFASKNQLGIYAVIKHNVKHNIKHIVCYYLVLHIIPL